MSRLDDIINKLFAMQDKEYKAFHQALMPTVDPEPIIGVRVPALRNLSKTLYNTKDADAFISRLPHKYYEENNLHAFLIEKIKDFEQAISETERFLPYIDNWATCDMFMPKVFISNKHLLIPYILKWIKSDNTYTLRYAVGLLMKLYLDEDFDEEYMKITASIKTSEYYVKMMIAWYFATALVKQYDSAMRYICGEKLDVWTHNKAIQKAIESNRIDIKMKEYLRKLKR